MKQKVVKRKLLWLVEKLAKEEIEKTIYSWPPECFGIFHQPRRPKR